MSTDPWLFVFSALSGLGGLAAFLGWLGIKPSQLGLGTKSVAAAKGAMHVSSIRGRRLKLVTGIILFFLSMGFSIFGLYRCRQSRLSVSEYPVQTPLEVIVGKKYINESLEVDGKRFEHCDFTNVTFMYHGLAEYSIVEDSFHGSLQLITDNISIEAFETLQQNLQKSPGVIRGFTGLMDKSGNIT